MTASDFGLKLQYAGQVHPRGRVDAFIVGRDFVADDNVALILGHKISTCRSPRFMQARLTSVISSSLLAEGLIEEAIFRTSLS